MKIKFLFTVTALCALNATIAHAAKYPMPANGDTVITEYEDDVPLIRSEEDETLLDVARRHSLGQTEIIRLNPDIDRWNVKKGEIVRISNKRILPDSPHKGITLNISEYRMYVYTGNGQIMSYAHGVGRQDWKTPLGQTSVIKKVKNPAWHPPESIRREHAAMGDPLPVIVPPGPHNPLGSRALYLNLPGDYRIHGTDIDKIFGIGMQITHGCVRMYPEDIEELFDLVSEGTPVYIVKQPIKVGWVDNVLYIEAHPDLEGEELSPAERYARATALIEKANNGVMPELNQAALDEALKKLTGDPMPIFERVAMPVDESMPINSVESTMPSAQAPMPMSVGNPISMDLTPPPPATVKKSKSTYPQNNYYSPARAASVN